MKILSDAESATKDLSSLVEKAGIQKNEMSPAFPSVLNDDNYVKSKVSTDIKSIFKPAKSTGFKPFD